MQPEEVDGIFEATISDLIELFGGDVSSIDINGYVRDNKQLVTKKVTVEDFVPHGQNYYLKIFSTLERLSDK